MIDLGKVFFLGAGKMASALAGGLVKQGYPAAKVTATDVSAEAAEHFQQTTGVKTVAAGQGPAAAAKADVLVLAVKPQHLAEALKPYRGKIDAKLIISIVAGKNIATIKELSGAQRVVRVMPNTPALVGKGAAGFAPSPEATAEDREKVQAVLGAVGVCREMAENLLDAVTGLSGSGPAYVFEFIQALADGGVYCGLPRDTALQLAIQTVLGSAQMAAETGVHPTILRDQVTSPAGTTGRGLQVLDAAGFHGLMVKAVEAGTLRSAELGKNK